MLHVILAVGFMLASAHANEIKKHKEEYQKWDQALNAIYGALKKELSGDLFALVREDQRDWVGHKEYMATWESKARGKVPAEEAGYWEMAAGLTESRVKFLKAWRGVGGEGNWSGEYNDGYGGWLRIVEQDGKVWFAVEVVRGPTCHLGHLGGELRVNEGLGWFETISEGEDQATWLTMLQHLDGDPRIRVVGANTQPFHGLRAYFDGAYLRVGLLDAQEQVEVIEIAKRGGSPE